MPNVRNENATSDLDGDGHVDAYDDVIAVVNDAANQELDELDMEGISVSDANMQWFKDNVVRPQPGIFAPPFTKAGWVRQVADVEEFASTIGQKLQAVIGGADEVWTPSALGAFVTGIFTVGITSVVSALASAVTNPETFPSQAVAQKISEMLPETLKKWLHEFIGSKRKLVIGTRRHSSFTVTKFEVAAYAVSLSVLTFAFAYVKAPTLNEILVVIPTVLVTSIIVEFTKNYVISVVARMKGVWTEHRLWYFGLVLFLFSSFVFRVPFSSPSRLTHNAPKFTKKSLGLVSAAQVLVAFAFAVVFYGLFISGYTLIGNIGIVMCLTMAFFDSIPIPPMNGKDIYDWSKFLWLSLFISAFTLYMLVLFTL
jgi:Zn-dependent protease